MSCVSCAHWQELQPLPHALVRIVGVCKSPRLNAPAFGPDGFSTEGDEHFCPLYTGPAFGCCHYEMKK